MKVLKLKTHLHFILYQIISNTVDCINITDKFINNINIYTSIKNFV